MTVNRQRLKERAFDRKRKRFGEDLCDLIGPTLTDGGASGDSVTLGTVASNLECFIEELSAGAGQTVVGGETFLSSHRVGIKKTSTTLLITPRHRLNVHARDGKAARVFEQPVITDESFTPLIILKAALVRQGYQL